MEDSDTSMAQDALRSIPLFAGRPLAPELAETFADLRASLVVTLVAQWAGAGQKLPAYGLGSPVESARRIALLDVGMQLSDGTADESERVVDQKDLGELPRRQVQMDVKR